MSTETLVVHILDKDYQVSCPSHERDALIKAAAELDLRMRSIRQSGVVIGIERIAVMAALNLAHEVISTPKTNPQDAQLLDKMQQQIDSILTN